MAHGIFSSTRSRKSILHLQTGAVADRGVLVELRRDLIDVDLDAIAGDRPAILLGVLAPRRSSFDIALAVADQDLVDGVQRELEGMLADELVTELLGPEPATAAQA